MKETEVDSSVGKGSSARRPQKRSAAYTRCQGHHSDRSSTASASPSTLSPTSGLPPLVYAQKPHTAEYHSDTLQDPYHWLHDRGNPQVKRLLKQENERVAEFFAAEQPMLRRTLFREMLARTKEDDVSLPSVDRGFWYYTRQVKNAEHPLYCRRPYKSGTVNADFLTEASALWRRDPAASLPLYDDEVVFLDVNLLAQQLRVDYVDIGEMDISPEESHVAITVDLSQGKEVFTVLVLPIENVNYHSWLQTTASDVHRAWAQEMRRQDKDIYTSPTTTGSLLLSSPSSSVGFSPRHARRRFPNVPLPVDRQSSSSPRSSPVASAWSRPQHTIQHSISMFDISSEVLWVNNSALLYTALDEKMRPYQLVHHDLTRDDTDPDATTVCYEEEDEAFWLDSIGFTADEQFLTFCTTSTESSEWYVSPAAGASCSLETDRATLQRRDYSGVPLVNQSNLQDGTGTDVNASGGGGGAAVCAPVVCFSRRLALPDACEYDIDHHHSLLGPQEGAWVITSNTQGCRNFSIFFLLDAEAADAFAAAGAPERELSRNGKAPRRPQWRSLFEYDHDTKVEGVECYRDVLLISVRRSGAPTVLLCPLGVVWAWWHRTRMAGGGENALAQRPLRLSDLLDLAALHDRATATTRASMTGVSDWEEVVHTWEEASALAGASLTLDTTADCNEGVEMGEEALCQLLGVDLPGVEVRMLPWNIECYAATTTAMEANVWRVVVTHLLYPASQFEMRYEPAARVGSDYGSGGTLRLQRIREEVVNGERGYDPAEYVGVVIWVPSAHAFTPRDGENAIVPVATREVADPVRIPVTLCWSRALYRRGGCPLILHVYGSYGDCSDPEFSCERLSLLDRGFVWGSAAVRGGGELGIQWRDAGRGKQRATAINDFLSVASYLQDHGICARGRLISSGGSAGGLVVFRAANQAPQLFHAIIGAVPFVDCLASLLDAELPLTITEWEEFGNPITDPEAYRLIKALSPMNTIPEGPGAVLPHILMETAWRDSRVGYWESLKYTARLRDVWSQGSAAAGRILLHFCEFDGGHGGATGRYQQLHEIAREYAFAVRVAEV